MKVLMVEDEVPIRNVLAMSLRKKGYDVVEADDATEASELLRQDGIDIVLLDLLMPKTDGADVLSFLEEMPGGKDIPVIIMTNLSEDEAREKVGARRIDAIMTKATSSLGQVAEAVAELAREKKQGPAP